MNLDNPRRKKGEVKFPADQARPSLVLQKTTYLEHMKPVQTSPDWGKHWQRSAAGARPGKLYEWFIQVDIFGKRGALIEEGKVIYLGLATPEQINDRSEFWDRYDTAMHNYLRWRTDYDTYGVIGRSYLSQVYAPTDVSKITIVRRFRHKQELQIGTGKPRRLVVGKQRVQFTEQRPVRVRGKGIKPPDFYDKYRKGGK